MATTLSSAAPTWARRVWADSQNIYLEVPCTSGPPFIQKFSKSDSGLSKALEFICLAFKDEQPLGSVFNLTQHPLTKSKPLLKFSDDSREKAREILKRMKIT